MVKFDAHIYIYIQYMYVQIHMYVYVYVHSYLRTHALPLIQSVHQWEFQDPQIEVLYYVRPYFVGIFPEP